MLGLLKHKLAEIGLQVHDTKQQLMRTSERVDVVWYKVSRDRRWLRNDNGYRFQRNFMQTLRQGFDSAEALAHFKSSVASWQGHALHGETEALRHTIFQAGSGY